MPTAKKEQLLSAPVNLFGPDFKEHPLKGPEPARLPVFKQLPDGQFESYNGAPTPDQFLLPDRLASEPRAYLPLDFVWSMLRAQSEAPSAP